jgi:hypothetical protein
MEAQEKGAAPSAASRRTETQEAENAPERREPFNFVKIVAEGSLEPPSPAVPAIMATASESLGRSTRYRVRSSQVCLTHAHGFARRVNLS